MIVVAFWGLTRSIKFTAESIQRHIFDQLPAHAVFVHTYASSAVYRNARANEFAAGLDADVGALKPFRAAVDDLEKVKQMLGLAQYRTQPDPWNSNYETVDNFVLAMYSKYRVTQMIAASGLPLEKVVFLRPDVQYTTSVRPVLALSAPDAWVIPNFHLYSGFNDRFCVASRDNYLTYGCVFPLLLAYSRKKPLHSETLYADLAKTKRIRLAYAPFFFRRIRLNGAVDPKDGAFKDPVRGPARFRRAPLHRLRPGPTISTVLLQPH